MDPMPAVATHTADIRLEGATLGWNVVGATVLLLSATVVVMLALAWGKHRVGHRLGNAAREARALLGGEA